MIIFCDIDGTLFNNQHRARAIPDDRSHTDNWHEFNALHIYDEAITHRIQLLNFMASEHAVIYVTSRTDTFHDSTKAQMNMAKCPPGHIVMRGEHEHRPSAEFKLDAIASELAQRGLSSAAFMLIDDDKHVCEAVAAEYPAARIVKVPSQCCAYLAQSRNLDSNEE